LVKITAGNFGCFICVVERPTLMDEETQVYLCGECAELPDVQQRLIEIRAYCDNLDEECKPR
jgi:hypothetical protein